MAYDDYRYVNGPQPGTFQTQGAPQQYGAPSDSIAGNIRERTPGGSAAYMFGGPMLGMAGTVAGSAGHAFGGGGLFKNLGNGSNWQNFATAGVSGARRSQKKAKSARQRAVAAWRQQQSQRLGGLLSQEGADVAHDLTPELVAALSAGGDMGDQNAVEDALTAFQARHDQYLHGRQQAGQARQVDAMFADPRRAAGQAQRLAAAKTQGLKGIAEQYRIGSRENAFNQARRGTQGGSTDIEQQGELGRARDEAGLNLGTGLEERSRQYRLGDQQQKSQLMGMIYGDNPDMAASFSRALEGINNSGRAMQEDAAIGAQQRAQRGAASTGYSQIFGNLLSSSSDSLGRYIDNRPGAGS